VKKTVCYSLKKACVRKCSSGFESKTATGVVEDRSERKGLLGSEEVLAEQASAHRAMKSLHHGREAGESTQLTTCQSLPCCPWLSAGPAGIGGKEPYTERQGLYSICPSRCEKGSKKCPNAECRMPGVARPPRPCACRIKTPPSRSRHLPPLLPPFFVPLRVLRVLRGLPSPALDSVTNSDILNREAKAGPRLPRRGTI